MKRPHKSNGQPGMRRACCRLAWLAIVCFFIAAAACSHKDSSKTVPSAHPTPVPGASSLSASSYRLTVAPFSPTLSHLFDEGRIFVLPGDHAPKPPAGSQASGYAFSAVDRYGRLYHFDAQGRWWMADSAALPETLPSGQWDVAWNRIHQKIELLVTADYAGEHIAQVYAWRETGWKRAAAAPAPLARDGATRLYAGEIGQWIIAGGMLQKQNLTDGWTLHDAIWERWGTPKESDAPTSATAMEKTSALAAAADAAPDLSESLALLEGPPGAGLELLTRSGALWLWREGRWRSLGHVNTEGLTLARYLPDAKQMLWVWEGAMGKDHFQLTSFIPNPAQPAPAPGIIQQTAMVKANEEDEGVWEDWGRVTTTDKGNSLSPGFAGTGEAGIKLAVEGGELVLRRSQMHVLELPPRLQSLRPLAAAYVPAMGGLVVPSIAGVGLDARQGPFFPPEAADAATSATAPTIDVIQRSYRFWVFKGNSVEWIKVPYELNPEIGYADSYVTAKGEDRSLSWIYPSTGLLRYEYHEAGPQNVQWERSPLLTLSNLPQLELQPGMQLFLCDPVVWGDPAEIVIVGWCGRLTPADPTQSPSSVESETYSEIPRRGFLARIPALSPHEWTISALPIPFCQGARLVVGSAQNALYLIGGKIASPIVENGKDLYDMGSHSLVWRWEGKDWHRIAPHGSPPRMKVTSNVAYHPETHQLLSLTPKAFYGFDGANWQPLWQRATPQENDTWPDSMGLYVHPLSHLILGGWYMPAPTFRVWSGSDWLNVTMPPPVADAEGTATLARELPTHSTDLLPAEHDNAFVSIDHEKLSRIRMDVDRNRDDDRLLTADLLTFMPEGAEAGLETQTPAPTPTATVTATPVIITTPPQATDAATTRTGSL